MPWCSNNGTQTPRSKPMPRYATGYPSTLPSLAPADSLPAIEPPCHAAHDSWLLTHPQPTYSSPATTRAQWSAASGSLFRLLLGITSSGPRPCTTAGRWLELTLAS